LPEPLYEARNAVDLPLGALIVDDRLVALLKLLDLVIVHWLAW